MLVCLLLEHVFSWVSQEMGNHESLNLFLQLMNKRNQPFLPYLMIALKLYSSADNVIAAATMFTYSHIPATHIWGGPCLSVGVLEPKTWDRKTYSLWQNMALNLWMLSCLSVYRKSIHPGGYIFNCHIFGDPFRLFSFVTL